MGNTWLVAQPLHLSTLTRLAGPNPMSVLMLIGVRLSTNRKTLVLMVPCSCASCIFADVVSLLNDVRLNKGMKPLSFLNPFLYSTFNGQVFFYITTGHSIGCLLPETLCDGGFKPVPGWDPATGYGSPNFGVLKTLLSIYFNPFAD